MQNALNWLVLHKVGLIIAWVATNLLNGISSYPGPDANVIEKVLHGIIDGVSIIARWNAAGWLKLPFMVGKPAASVVGSPVGKTPVPKGFIREQIAGCCAIGSLLVLGLLAGSNACKTTSPIPNQVLSCAEQALPSAAVSLVTTALTSTSPNWAADLEQLGVTYGLPVVECIVGELIGDWKVQQDAGLQAQMPSGALVTPVVQVRAQAWLAAHEVAFK